MKTELEIKKEKRKAYYEKNKDRINKLRKDKRKAFYRRHKDKILQYNKEYYEKNKDRIIKQQAKKQKEYYQKNKEKIQERQKKYEQENKQKINIRKQNYTKNRLKLDSLFSFKVKIRKLLYHVFSKKGYKKLSKSELILGCSFEVFKQHIENQWESWMNWDNYGKYSGEYGYGWDIDHIIPLDSAKTESEVIRLSHYTNMQPLDSKVNRYEKKHY